MIRYTKPPCPHCLGTDPTLHVRLSFDYFEDEDCWDDAWYCGVHGQTIKRAEGEIK